MIFANKLWYAKINGRIYAFQSKHQRDLAGGENISESDIPTHANVKYITFDEFDKWYVARKQKPRPLR